MPTENSEFLAAEINDFLDVVPSDMQHWFLGLAFLDISDDRAHMWMNRDVVVFMPCGDENCCCIQVHKDQEPVIVRDGCEHGERYKILFDWPDEITLEVAELSIEELRVAQKQRAESK